MRDFNFFEPYLTPKKQLSRKQLVLYSFASIVVMALVAVPIINQFTINKTQQKAASASAIVYSEEVQTQREEINNRKKQLHELKDYYKLLESVDDEIINIDIINDLFLQTITDRVPEEVFFENISISQDSVMITAIAQSNVSIAEFEQNLRELPYFEDVFIPNISANAGGYTFTVSFKIKGENDDEAN